MVGFFSRNDGSVGGQGEVDTRVGNQVSLELSQVDVEGTIESKRSGDRRNDLTNQSIEVGVGGSFNVEVSTADVVDGLVIDHKSTVRVFQGGVGGQDGVVRLNNSS